MEKQQVQFEKKAVGRVSKPYGAEGELIMTLYDIFPAEPDFGEPLWVTIDSIGVPLYLERFERRGRTSAVVRFADMDTQRRAAELIGREVSALVAAQEERNGELYMEDLVGFTAFLDGTANGRIEEFYDNDLNPLFRVDVGGREVLIPAADDFIERVDERSRRIWFSLPEGLLTVNDQRD